MNARLNSLTMPVPDARAETAARARQQQLTKPPGSLPPRRAGMLVRCAPEQPHAPDFT